MNKGIGLVLIALLAGCGRQEPVAPSGTDTVPTLQAAKPSQQVITATPPAITNVTEAQPASQSFGGAAVDVITQRNKIEAGRNAKSTIENAAASENKDLEAVLNE